MYLHIDGIQALTFLHTLHLFWSSQLSFHFCEGTSLIAGVGRIVCGGMTKYECFIVWHNLWHLIPISRKNLCRRCPLGGDSSHINTLAKTTFKRISICRLLINHFLFFSQKKRKSNVWCIEFHKYETYHCIKQILLANADFYLCCKGGFSIECVCFGGWGVEEEADNNKTRSRRHWHHHKEQPS